MFAEREAELLVAAARTPADLDSMIVRRVAGIPLELVIGWAEFCGLRIVVEPGVFVPRRRTEFLVESCVSLGRAQGGAPTVIVDLCCGSGAVGSALAALLEPVELVAVDIDPAAVRCARSNDAARRQGGRGRPLRAAAVGAPGPGRSAGRERTVRAHRGDPAAAAGGA